MTRATAGVASAVTVRDLGCTYAGATRPALDGLTCELPAGGLAVVMGATGAGKSTLARCLTRLVPCFLPADLRGEIRLLGQPIDGARVGALAGTIGMVFQDFEAQLFSTDVTQEIVFGLEHTGVAPDQIPERVTRALAAVGLAGFEGRDPTTLSGGEKQRLAIAGLLALRPPIMVLDEPTTDLDPTGRAEVFDVLGRLRAEGLSLVLIEHDTAAAAAADLLVLLRDGRIAASGAPARLLADVDACLAAGVRPPDVCRVFAMLGLVEPPLDVTAAAERLRARGLVPRVSDEPVSRPAAGSAIIEMRGLGHRYPDGRRALADVSLSIGRGEFIALVGPNGSGKTTLAKHLNGLLAPTEGRVTLEGRDVAGLPLETLAQRVGYVFQDPDHQLFAATVAEEVAFGPQNVGLPAAEVEARVAEALAAVELRERDADPFLLDKGARQRLAVAAILALRPDVLVLDEPTTGLDFREQERMLDLLDRLHAAGRTVIIITHTPWVIAEHARRVVLLKGGRIRYDGPLRPFFADEGLAAEAAFRPPEVTRLGRLLGCTPLSVAELVAWIGRGA
ncbi:MAG: energy-coupling factor ABC transporter ATP-binding protein [Deltaproteobacteria bacterium]|nr:MAG: energy-coupling factor ABC transporter ATP-binding protein [Deltaproteobacteria bacterium]